MQHLLKVFSGFPFTLEVWENLEKELTFFQSGKTQKIREFEWLANVASLEYMCVCVVSCVYNCY